MLHTIQPGEKTSTIAAAYGIPVAQLLQANPRRPTTRLGSGELVFASLGAGETIEVPSTGLGTIPRIHDPNAPIQQHDEPAPPAKPEEGSSIPWVPIAIGGAVLIAAVGVVAMALRPPSRASNPLQRFGVYAKRHGKWVFVEDHRDFETARKHAQELADEGKTSVVTDVDLGTDGVVWRSTGVEGHHRMNPTHPKGTVTVLIHAADPKALPASKGLRVDTVDEDDAHRSAGGSLVEISGPRRLVQAYLSKHWGAGVKVADYEIPAP